jgi:hypothetical protein
VIAVPPALQQAAIHGFFQNAAIVRQIIRVLFRVFLVEKITCAMSETRVWAMGVPLFIRPFSGSGLAADSIPWTLSTAIEFLHLPA